MSTTSSAVPQRSDASLSPAMLRELSARSNGKGLLRVASHYGAIAVTACLIWLVLSTYGAAWALPLIAVQSCFVAFLFMPLHETAHKTAFHGRRLNLAFGHLSALAIALPYEYYRLFHWDHHRYTQDPKRDPELMFASIPSSDTQLAIAYTGLLQLVRRVRLMLRHAFTGKVTVPWVPADKHRLVVQEARIYAAVYIALLLASVALSTLLLLWVWIVPMLLGQLILRPYLYAEHTGCARVRSAFENTRTTYTGALMRWLTWNMPYHVEHHAYPSVPFHALPKLNQIVADKIAFPGRGYRAVTRETWAWFRRARYHET
jgi:fatty acid desaturase